ncbi:MAG: type 1 glutamine amidotransferase [Chlamydiae bacterium]|nr:type 1 glutamine amidotransferase [Chlamydiota bacterium]MBI3266638.1 type 1 glutamine amidotransferase [Chlamydiota bacterium]
MNPKILILQNATGEGPGILEGLLREKTLPYELIDLNRGLSCPSPRDFSAWVVLGGPDSANDETPKMEIELAKVREALDLKIPYLGICLGLQVLVKASGGQVVKSPVKEIGFRDPQGGIFQVELTSEGKKDPLLRGLSDQSTIFHLHGEAVVLTKEMTLLGKGKFCQNQIVKVADRAYGIQGHFELTPEMFELWIQEDPDLLELNQDELRRDFAFLREEYGKVGKTLFRNFLAIAGL